MLGLNKPIYENQQLMATLEESQSQMEHFHGKKLTSHQYLASNKVENIKKINIFIPILKFQKWASAHFFGKKVCLIEDLIN